MDTSSLASEIPDLLQFLRPSVKKLSKNHLYGYKYIREVDDYLLVPSIPRRKRRRRREPHPSDLETSTSLILHKTKERPREKVCIDIGTVPLSEQRSSRGDHSIESREAQTIRESTSYQQVTTKDHVYLVIAGNRTEKVYKISTKGGGNPTDITPSVNVEERNDVTNVNQVNMTVNMDKKKKKRKNCEERFEKITVNSSPPVQRRTDQSAIQKCMCRSNSPNPHDVAVSKSRLRITGRLGLTHDDRYVLRCAATLDDQPIDANFTDLDEMSPNMLFCNNFQQQPQKQQQQFITDNGCVNESCPNMRVNKRSIHVQTETKSPRVVTGVVGKDSHGTQVSLNELVSNVDAKLALDQIIQCYCAKNYFATDNTIENDKTNQKNGQSIIVSVTPSKEPQERYVRMTKNTAVNILTQQKRNTSPKSVNNERVKDTQTQQTNRGNVVLKSAIPRPKNNSKNNATAEKLTELKSMNRVRNGNKRDETRNNILTLRTNQAIPKIDTSFKTRTPDRTRNINDASPDKTKSGNDGSPDRTRLRNAASPDRTRLRNASSPDRTRLRNVTSPDRTKMRNAVSPDRMKTRNDASPDRTRINASSNNRKSTINKMSTTIIENTRTHVANTKKAPKYESTNNTSKNKTKTTGTITDHAITKKALIDSWTRQMIPQMNENTRGITKETRNQKPTSNISVNIDGTNEYYDLLFYQDSMETDMTVRKRLKKRPGSAAPQKTLLLENDDQSMENFMPPYKDAEKSASQTWTVEKAQDVAGPILSASPSGLHVRDSIEISHRREDRANSLCHNIKITQTNYHYDNVSGTMKHFRGDECSIQDPIERDKEIREVLGVEKLRRAPVLHKEGTCCGSNQTEVIIQNIYNNYDRKLYHPKPPPSTQSEEINRTILEPTKTAVKYQIHKAKNRQNQHEINNKRLLLVAKMTTPKLSKREYEQIRSFINSIQSKTKEGKSRQERHKKRIYKKNSKHSNCSKRKRVTPFMVYDINTAHNHKNTQTKPLKTSKPVEPVEKSIGDNFPINKVTSPADPDADILKDIPKKYKLVELFNAETAKRLKKKMADPGSPKENHMPKNLPAMKATSTLELNYTGFKYPASKSATNIKMEKARPPSMKTNFYDNDNMGAWGKEFSVHTLFKGRRKSATPNLGTSLFSLNERRSSHAGLKEVSQPARSRQPFLKRLIPCLVRPKASAANANLRAEPSTLRTIESSIDSYQINTSLAALELSSSIFDTSESFYSNHSIANAPTSKMKRGGFFSSVWGFMRS